MPYKLVGLLGIGSSAEVHLAQSTDKNLSKE